MPGWLCRAGEHLPARVTQAPPCYSPHVLRPAAETALMGTVALTPAQTLPPSYSGPPSGRNHHLVQAADTGAKASTLWGCMGDAWANGTVARMAWT